MNSLPVGTDIYTKRLVGTNFQQEWDNYMNMSFQPGRSYDERMGNFQKQITNANHALQNLSNIKSIDFDFTVGNTRENAKLLAQVPNIWNQILDNIDFNQKWLVRYQYKDVWMSRKLDEVNSEYLKDQINEDFKIPQLTVGLNVVPAEYNFFACRIREIERVSFVNTAKFNDSTQLSSTGAVKEVKTARWEDSDSYKFIMNTGNVPQSIIDALRRDWKTQMQKQGFTIGKRTYKHKAGSFWKWTCKLPINLERYMIFNELNERTIKLMEEDNCLIYACKQYGVKQDIIDQMKDIIKTKSFTMSKLKEISKEVDIGFYVEEKDGRHHKIGNQEGIVVPLLLLNEHYMLNERVNISTYFIKNYYDIISDPIAKNKSKEDQQMITRRRELHGKLYYVTEKGDFPLKLILKTLFKYNYFEPIKMGDYLTYASTLYKYKLDPIDDLDYNPKFCCRLKSSKNGLFRNIYRER